MKAKFTRISISQECTYVRISNMVIEHFIKKVCCVRDMTHFVAILPGENMKMGKSEPLPPHLFSLPYLVKSRGGGVGGGERDTDGQPLFHYDTG